MGGIPLAITLLALAFQEWDPRGAATAIQDFGFDRYIAAAPWTTATADETSDLSVLYVELDAPRGNAPLGTDWERADIARLIGHLEDAGARAVILDEPLARRAATSPNVFADALEQRGTSTDITNALRQLPDPDEALSRALSNVTSVAAIDLNDNVPPPAPLSAEPIEFDGNNPATVLPPYKGAFTDGTIYADTSNGAGVITLPTGGDGVVRRVPLLFSIGGDVFPSTALETLRLVSNAPVAVRSHLAGNALPNLTPPGIQEIMIGDRQIPTTSQGEIWLHPPGPSAAVSVNGSAVLQGTLDNQRLEDTLVFVGFSQSHLSNFRTVDGQRLTRAQIQMLAYDQISSGHFISRPYWTMRAEQAYIIVFGLMIWAAAAYASVSLSAVFASLAIAVPAYFGLVVFENYLLLFDFIIPCATLILIFLTTAVWQSVRTQWINQLTGKDSAAPELVPFKVRYAQSSHRPATVMVCSVRGMGDLADQYEGSPFAVKTIVDRAFAHAAGIVGRHSGQAVLRGDTLLAFWVNAQEERAHATNACECALALVEKLEDLNASLEKEFSYDGLAFRPITLNLGIASGACIVSKAKRRRTHPPTIFGGPVVLASDLSRRAEQYGPAIILDAQTAKLEGHQLAHLKIESLRPAAGAPHEDIFALLGNAFVRANPRFRELSAHHSKLFAAVRNQLWDEAAAINDACRQLPGASQPLYDFYADRIAHRQMFVEAAKPNTS